MTGDEICLIGEGSVVPLTSRTSTGQGHLGGTKGSRLTFVISLVESPVFQSKNDESGCRVVKRFVVTKSLIGIVKGKTVSVPERCNGSDRSTPGDRNRRVHRIRWCGSRPNRLDLAGMGLQTGVVKNE